MMDAKLSFKRLVFSAVGIVLCLIIGGGPLARAQNSTAPASSGVQVNTGLSDDLRAIYQDGPYFSAIPDKVSNACSAATTTISDPGQIPKEWLDVFQKAAEKYQVDVKLVASLFYTEHGGGWTPINSVWASSPTGAKGPFQFLDGTWDSLKEDADGNGVADVQNPTDAAFAAAHYLKNMGGAVGMPTGGNDQPQGFLRGMKEQPLTAASVFARYNQGPGSWKEGATWFNNKGPLSDSNQKQVTGYITLATGVYQKLGGTNANLATATSGTCGGAFESLDNITYFSQVDPRWKASPYGIGTIAECACGPTSLAMVVATLNKGSAVTPPIVADWAYKNGHQIGGGDCGSSWSLFVAGAKNWGLSGEDLGVDLSKARSAIEAGGLVIASMDAASPFTDGGHFIVIRSISPTGQVLVADPNDGAPGSANYLKKSKTTWNLGDFSGWTKGMWAIHP